MCSKDDLPNELSGNGKHDHDGRKDHQVGIQEEEHAGMVEAPLSPQAAGSLCHAPRGNQQSENLPVRSMQVLDVRKAGQAQAGGKCAQRKENGAHERFLPQAKDREEEMHNPSMYRGGAAEAICRIQGPSGVVEACGILLRELKPTIVLLKAMCRLMPVPFKLPSG